MLLDGLRAMARSIWDGRRDVAGDFFMEVGESGEADDSPAASGAARSRLLIRLSGSAAGGPSLAETAEMLFRREPRRIPLAANVPRP